MTACPPHSYDEDGICYECKGDYTMEIDALNAQVEQQAETIKDAHKRHAELATRYYDLKERCDKVGCWRKP